MSPKNINKFKLLQKLGGEIDHKELEIYLCASCNNCIKMELGPCRDKTNPMEIKFRRTRQGTGAGVFHLYPCHSHD